MAEDGATRSWIRGRLPFKILLLQVLHEADCRRADERRVVEHGPNEIQREP